jgi:transcription initiation factor TFIIB
VGIGKEIALLFSSLVREKAAIVYRKALEKDVIKGRTIVAVTAAYLYAACQITRTPRTLKEISDISFVEKREIGRCYRFLLRKPNLRIPLADPLIYISKIGEKAGVSCSTQGFALKIL